MTRKPDPRARPRGAAARPISLPLFAGGIACLAISLGATLMLTLEHLVGLSLPGCGPGSGCAQAAASAWGKLPGTSWPVSFVGFAYFFSMLAGWATARQGVPPALRLIGRAGALASLLYVVVIATGKYNCVYCLTAHAGNFAFWLLLESAAAAREAPARPALITCIGFLLVNAVLGAAEWGQKGRVAARGERELADSTAAIIAATSQKAAPAQAAGPITVAPPSPAPATTTGPSPPAAADARALWPGGFTGRHRLGPEKAPIRLVIISDYQCRDCQRTEAEVSELLRHRSDVSLSILHFPFAADCNPEMKGQTLHPNACWAARAAETAAILRGEEGFWQMHRWLFEHKGAFTGEEFRPALQSMGYDPKVFGDIMGSQQTLSIIQEDIRKAAWLGLHFTPMIFINGVELRGVFTPNAVPRAVEAVAAKNPPALTCEADLPPPAGEKFIADWREQFVVNITRLPDAWPDGPDDARVKVVLWGDYQEPYTAKADAAIRGFMAGRKDVQYYFRHYPVCQTCNPYSALSILPKGCQTSKAAMTAGMLGGARAFWKLHQWLMAHQADYNEDALAVAAGEAGLDVNLFFRTLPEQKVNQAVFEDAKAGKLAGLTQVPTIFVNGRKIPRWTREGDNILERILAEAAGE
jgi:protein-disulfide isomerase/uncharacterized membrane protein